MQPRHRVKVLAVVVALAGCASSPRATCGNDWASLSRADRAPRLGLEKREGITIERVQITGVDDRLARTLRAELQTRPGTSLTDAPLADDLRRLWQLGVIEDASVVVGNGEVTFALAPRRTITRVVRKGGDALAQARFRQLEATPFEASRIRRMAEALQESYVREGRLDAHVEARQRVHATGVDVCVAANPGPRVTIDKLEFPGAKAVPEKTLVATLHGKEANVNRVGGAFDEAALAFDEIYLQVEYWERGHLDVKIGKPALKRHGKRLHVAIPIVEGPSYRLGTIVAPIAVPLRSGALFKRSNVVKAIEMIQKIPNVQNVVPHTIVERETHRVDITFECAARDVDRPVEPRVCLRHVVVEDPVRPPACVAVRASEPCADRRDVVADRAVVVRLERDGHEHAIDHPAHTTFAGRVFRATHGHALAEHDRRLLRAGGQRHCESQKRSASHGYLHSTSNVMSTRCVSRSTIVSIMRDEAELAAVIAHEMGHTIAGHHREAIADMKRDVGETELQRWRDLRYARDDEIQADDQAVLFLARAGYDVYAVERMLRAIGGWEEDDDEDASDDRHPIWRERIARVAALAARHPDGERGVDRYNARVARLVVGEDSQTAAVVGSTIMFGRAGVAIDLPHETKAFLVRGMVVFSMPGEVVGTAQLIDRNLITAKIKNDGSSHTELKKLANAVLAITIVKDDKGAKDPAGLAKALVAKTRGPRPDELARVQPRRFDPTKPRAIWAR